MVSREKRYYLCECFRPIYLLVIFFKDILFKNTEVVIYYLKPNTPTRFNRPSVFIEKNDELFSKIFAYRIMIKQLPFDSPVMNNYLVGSLYQKACIDKLYEIMHRIDKEILQSKQSMLNFLDNKLSALIGSLRLHIKHEIALDITNELLLVEVAGYLLENPQSLLYKADLILFIDKRNYWTKFVFEYANEKRIAFLGVNKFTLKKNKAVQFGFYLLQLFVEYFGSFFIRKKPQSQKTVKRIGIPYYYYDNFTEFFNKRNYYLFWYPESEIDPWRIIIYADGNMDISLEEKRRIENLGFTTLSCNSLLKKGANFAPIYKCSFKAIKLLFNYIRQLINLLFHIRTIAAFEQWKILAVLFVKLPYWEDFFSNNDIKIKFRFHDIFSHREIAANLTGAVTVSYNYSNHAPDIFSILHQDLCDIYFTWGEKHQRCILNEHSDIKNIVRTGYIFDYTFSFLERRAEQLRKTFIDKGKNFVIAIMDEDMAGPYRKSILYLYRSLFEFSFNNPDVGLIIKPKKRSARDILESSEETSGLFHLLEKEGTIKLLDNLKYPAEAGKASDLAIGVYADSTAALECSLAGIATIIYECFIDEHRSDPYHKNSKDKIIFYDIQTMLNSIQMYKTNRERSNGFADWSGLLKERDPFRDGKANKRIGLYIKTLLYGFDSGLAKDIAVKESNRIYAAKFGSDKAISLL